VDAAAAKERGIIVTNTPGVLTGATADLTWALILGVTRRVGEGERMIRANAWPGWAFDQLLGMELRGKQLGIIGYGRIGRAVAARAEPFGMRIAYVARSADDRSAGAMPLDRLLSTSDVVSIHVPLTAETRHMIDQPALARMKRSAYLVNVARGPVVDEACSCLGAKEPIDRGAALDVYEEEPRCIPSCGTFENVVLAPHLGSATTETRTAMADLAVSNVLAVLSGQPPLTPVG
jgi:glyoxylate reductase